MEDNKDMNSIDVTEVQKAKKSKANRNKKVECNCCKKMMRSDTIKRYCK